MNPANPAQVRSSSLSHYHCHRPRSPPPWEPRCLRTSPLPSCLHRAQLISPSSPN
ncbi:hypothetical protein M413DRAFT_446615 [Hebeloma cylindrosporum]|uniref:Uncharacterized protein n=1 Tax=Hebeloma cylindrosporum TaxID=76867 RepID=A0A0C2YF90_HEBCY|nr:hypothetical protein M413DRAFT_446615 [Hebeloma cylindrosporum h7]